MWHVLKKGLTSLTFMTSEILKVVLYLLVNIHASIKLAKEGHSFVVNICYEVVPKQLHYFPRVKKHFWIFSSRSYGGAGCTDGLLNIKFNFVHSPSSLWFSESSTGPYKPTLAFSYDNNLREFPWPCFFSNWRSVILVLCYRGNAGIRLTFGWPE